MRTAIAYSLAALAGAATLSTVASALAAGPVRAAPAGALAAGPVRAAPAGALAAGPVRAAQSGRAHTARALNITDTAHLHFVRETAGSILIDEGKATGGLPGVVKVGFEVGATVKASFMLSSRHGELIGSGVAKPHSSGGEYTSFAGTLTITHGTARYAHAHGQGGFYGTIDRGNDAVTVQTTGTLAY